MKAAASQWPASGSPLEAVWPVPTRSATAVDITLSSLKVPAKEHPKRKSDRFDQLCPWAWIFMFLGWTSENVSLRQVGAPSRPEGNSRRAPEHYPVAFTHTAGFRWANQNHSLFFPDVPVGVITQSANSFPPGPAKMMISLFKKWCWNQCYWFPPCVFFSIPGNLNVHFNRKDRQGQLP